MVRIKYNIAYEGSEDTYERPEDEQRQHDDRDPSRSFRARYITIKRAPVGYIKNTGEIFVC